MGTRSALLVLALLSSFILTGLLFSNAHPYSINSYNILHRAAGHARHAIRRSVQDLRLLSNAFSFYHSTRPQRLLHRRSRSPQCRLQVFPSAGSGRTPTPHPTPSTLPHPGNNGSASTFRLVHSYSANDFFEQWDFWDTADPTHGVVDYLSKEEAQTSGLASVNSNGNLVMRVDTTPQVSTLRKSIRITTQASFNGGLLIMDALHMPTGCGTWPAFWTNGPNWPLEGEIDIIEGVNDYVDNQATVHTGHGCTLPSNFSSPPVFSQSASGQLVGGTNCAAAETQNQGCGIRFLDPTSFGTGFNQNGGGVYAMLWDLTGISVYFFPRQSIPSDIVTGKPTPQTWGLPNAKWPSSACSPSQFFKDHVAIFDTTLCGDWAGSVWDNAGIPGQDQSCAQRTGETSCVTYVLNNGRSFTEAYWEVSYVKLFQNN